MKKVILILFISLLFAGAATAASINGDYKGNPVVKVTANGKELKVEDVPAILYDNRTMVPLYLLRQLGVEVTWDLEKFSADVKLPSQQTSSTQLNTSVDVPKTAKDLKKYNIDFVDYISDGEGFNEISYYYKGKFDELNQKIEYLDALLTHSTTTDASMTRIIDSQGTVFWVLTDSIRDFKAGKITAEELSKQYHLEINGKDSSLNQAPTQNNNLSAIEYPELYSNDGKTYLGKLTTNKYDSDSIYNEYGTYGSKYSEYSIWNEYGTYGSKYSTESAFNNYTTTPPIIVINGNIIGYLTTNTAIANGISPYGLENWLEDNGY